MQNLNWEDIYRQQAPRMLGLCRRYVHDLQKAEDLMHDAFLTAIHKTEKFSGTGALEGWLRSIIVNTVLMYLRQEKKVQFADISDALSLPETLDDQTDSDPKSLILAMGFSKDDLLEVLDRIPEHHRVVFNLYVFESWSHKDIGAALGISPGTSKSHLARARKKIQEILLIQAQDMQKKKKRAALFIFPFLEKDTSFVDHLYQKTLEDNSIPPSAMPEALANALKKTAAPVAKPPFNWLKITAWASGLTLLVAVALLGSRTPDTTHTAENAIPILPVTTTAIAPIYSDSPPAAKKPPGARPASIPVKNNSSATKSSDPAPAPVIVNKKVIQKDTVYQIIDQHDK